MAKHQKGKSAKGTRNDARKNGKSAKQHPGRTKHREPLTEVQKILLGQGLYKKWNRVLDGKAKGLPQPDRNKLSVS